MPRSRHGFTLIEIIVVLALAALILAGVLLAISSAQQSVRDSQRRAAVSQVESAMEQWGATHSGSNAGQGGGMLTIGDLYGAVDSNCGVSSPGPQYLDVGINAPGGGHYTCPTPKPYGAPTATNQISISDRDGTNTTNDGYCIRVMLEGGNHEIYGATDTNKTARNLTGGCN